MDLGQVVEVELVVAKDEDLPVVREGSVEEALKPQVNLFGISLQSEKTVEQIKWRQQQMSKILRESNKLLSEEHLPLEDLLVEYHDIEEDERGETDLIEFEIDTSDEAPKKQSVRRTPFASHQEIANQLERMQRSGVITPSKSPWSSPVVLVRKRDGTLRFCVDYRVLNSVTKPARPIPFTKNQRPFRPVGEIQVFYDIRSCIRVLES